jgi:predicted nucleic acid-binding protein
LGLTNLSAFLRRHKRIALDTSVFIYQLEANPRYVSVTGQVFKWIERAGHAAVTMAELLVQPYRGGDHLRVNEFYALLATYPNLEWIAARLELADTAARLRAAHRLRTPDALQAASAIHAQATGFITNDPVFTRVDAFETLVLDRILAPETGFPSL